jgi:DHA1 family bicyclomycin/chloramphenicol resistance-like MFS transporter
MVTIYYVFKLIQNSETMQKNSNITVTIFSLGAIFSLAPLAIDMYLPALPTMAIEFGSSIDSMEATVSVFLLGYAISQLVLGPVSDMIGRIPVLIGGLMLFTLASLMVAFASTPVELYIFRFLQALGGGASVTVFAFVNDRFSEKQSAQIISYIMAVVAVAPLVAPVIGGEILVLFGWQWIFFGLTAYAVMVLGLTVIVFGKNTGHQEFQNKTSSRNGNPLKEVAGAYHYLLKNRRALAHIFTGSFAFAGMFAFIAGSPYVYIDYFGVAANHYGYFVAVNASLMIVLNVINAKYLHKIAPTQKMIVASVLLSVISIVMLASIAIKPSIVLVAISTAAFIGLLGMISANAIAGALSSVNQHGGTTSALYGVTQFSLGAVSSGIISVFVSTDASTMLTVMAISGLLSATSALTLVSKQRQIFIQSEA